MINKIKKYFLDCIFIAGVILSIFLELSKIISSGDKSSCFNSDIIIVLFPTIITIVSISISISKEKIYGVSLYEFMRFRKNTSYSFLHMILIFIVIFIIYSFIQIKGLLISKCILDFIVIFYSLLFIIQDIPILCQNKNRIQKIIKKRYINRNKSNDLLEKRDEGLFFKLLQYMIMKEGLDSTFIFLAKTKNKNQYNENCIEDLLTIQNNYLRKLLEEIDIISFTNNDYFYDINILQSIDNGFKNIIILLYGTSNGGILDYYPNNKLYYLTQSTFILHELCYKLNLNNKERKQISDIINSFLVNSYDTNPNDRPLLYIAYMTIGTLSNGQVWFLKYLRDNNIYPSVIFTPNKCQIGVYISIFISYLLSESTFSSEKKDILNSFLIEANNSINGDGKNWIQLFSESLEFSTSNVLADTLLSLTILYRNISDSIYLINNNGVYYSDDIFSYINVIDAWLEMILFGNCYSISEKDICHVINQLHDEEKNYLVNTLSNKWLKNNRLNYDYKAKFLNVFGYDVIVNENFYNQNVVKCLADFRNSFLIDKQIEKISNDLPNVISMKEQIQKSIDNYIRNHEFFDDSLSLIKEKNFYFSWYFERGNLSSLLKMYLDNLPRIFDSYFKSVIEENVKRLNFKEKYTIIKDFKPNYHSALTPNFYDNDLKFNLGNMKHNSILPLNFFYNEGAIKVNISFEGEKSNIRYLDDSEIDNIIDNKYEMTNGLYKYNEFCNDINNDIYLSRNELKSLLKSKLLYGVIAFKRKIVIDNTKCIRFDNNK